MYSGIDFAFGTGALILGLANLFLLQTSALRWISPPELPAFCRYSLFPDSYWWTLQTSLGRVEGGRARETSVRVTGLTRNFPRCLVELTEASPTLTQCVKSSDWASSSRALNLLCNSLFSCSSFLNMASACVSAAFWPISINSISSTWVRSMADIRTENRQTLLAISVSTAN